MNYNTMSHIPVQQNHWLSFGFKFVSIVGGCALVATLLGGFVHQESAPPATAPIAQQVAYFSKDLGKVGQNSHWITQASENTAQWQKAKAYCQQESAEQDGAGHVHGCGTIDELANSGY